MKFKSAIAAGAVALLAAAPASAGVVITSIQINNSGAAGPVQSYLQVAELQVFSGGVNVALNGTATASSVYSDVFGGPSTAPSKAIDGLTDGAYVSDGFYHSVTPATAEFLRVSFAAPVNAQSINIFGRSDACCTFRDSYTYTLFNGLTQVGSGTLTPGANLQASVALPEPATWAMMMLGFGMIGFGLRSRRKPALRVTYA